MWLNRVVRQNANRTKCQPDFFLWLAFCPEHLNMFWPFVRIIRLVWWVLMTSHTCPLISDPDFSGEGRSVRRKVQGVSKNWVLLIWALTAKGHPSLKIDFSFSNILLKLDRIKRSLVTNMGKYGPLAPDFGFIFWAQFIASQETIFSLKILAKLDAMGPNFPICMTWETNKRTYR